MALIPPQFQLALSLLRGLVPILGYIGSFIAWSWSAVRVFDRGTVTVVLTILHWLGVDMTFYRIRSDLDGDLAVADRSYPRDVAVL